MPSSNFTFGLSSDRRVIINRCEGETALVYQTKHDDGRWITCTTIAMDDEQAEDLGHELMNP